MATAMKDEDKKAAKRKRAKLRRQAKHRDVALSELMKPVEEWDDEELARGRPKASDGSFRGSTPQWVSRQIHEEAVKVFTERAQGSLRGLVPMALETIEYIIQNKDTDEDGKPLVPMSTKLDAAKWAVEHLVGKPTQRVQADISVRLQAVLAHALVQPGQEGQMGMVPAIDVESWEQSNEESDDDEDLPT